MYSDTMERPVKLRGLTISWRYLLLAVAVLFFVPSPYLQRISMIDNLYDFGRIVIPAAVIPYWLSAKKKSWAWIIALVIYYVWILLVSVIQGAASTLIKNYISILVVGPSLIMLVDLYTRYDYLHSISTIRRTLEILFWINFVSVLLRPSGLYTAIETNQNYGYFLGMRNNTIEVILLLLGVSLIEEHLTKQRLTHTVLLAAAALLTFIISSSMNAALCTVFLLAYILFFYHSKPSRILNMWFYFVVSAIMTILLTVFSIQYNIE